MDEYDKPIFDEIVGTKINRYNSAQRYRRIAMRLSFASAISSVIAAILIASNINDYHSSLTTIIAIIAAIPAAITTINGHIKPSSRSQWHRRYAIALDDLEAEAKFGAISGLELDKKLNEIKRQFTTDFDDW